MKKKLETPEIIRRRMFYKKKLERTANLNTFVIIGFKTGSAVPMYGDCEKIDECFITYKADIHDYLKKYKTTLISNHTFTFDLADVEYIQKVIPPRHMWQTIEEIQSCSGNCMSCKSQCLFSEEELKDLPEGDD